MFALLVAAAVFIADAQFNIPLPFGQLGIGKNDKGELEVTGNNNFNLFGWGAKRNFRLTSSNATFQLEKSDTAILNGSEFGDASRLAVDEKRGIDVGQNVTIDDKTAVGGPGKEANFLADLLAALQSIGRPKN